MTDGHSPLGMIHDERTDPLRLFREWYAAARQASPLAHPDAVFVSTSDEHGFPEGRFVDLKAVSESGFVFCTHLDSRKARALATNPNVALTFWWDHIERQVRVVGRAERIADADADTYFQARSRDARLTSWASQQSAVLPDPAQLEQRVEAARRRFHNADVPRPVHWGGYRVVPSRIEFLAFRANRRHERLLFERRGHEWTRTWLQP